MTASEERAVIDKVLDGDTNAFEALVLAHQKNVYNLALKMTASEHDAFDASQDAFIKAFTNLKSFRGDSRFSVWLYRLTYNICIDMMRRRKRAPVVPLTTYNADSGEQPLDVPDERFEPEKLIEQREMRAAIVRGIDALPDKHREILVMREVTGMSYEEIAGALGISSGTVKSRLSRARQNLVTILERGGTFPDGTRHKAEKEVDRHD